MSNAEEYLKKKEFDGQRFLIDKCVFVDDALEAVRLALKEAKVEEMRKVDEYTKGTLKLAKKYLKKTQEETEVLVRLKTAKEIFDWVEKANYIPSIIVEKEHHYIERKKRFLEEKK